MKFYTNVQLIGNQFLVVVLRMEDDMSTGMSSSLLYL